MSSDERSQSFRKSKRKSPKNDRGQDVYARSLSDNRYNCDTIDETTRSVVGDFLRKESDNGTRTRTCTK